ncbi:MAG TPA: hypothetical protein VFQ77_11355, partial [Pseudonocardiaceae bacterium]|nr:hypothetical protein [Pseudonocardiaceae bacterium]
MGFGARPPDLDHPIAWGDGGTTCQHNLYGCCRHDHRLKTHAPGWHVHQEPDGRITWTTPTGHTYASHPHDYRPEPAPSRAPDPAPPTPEPRPQPERTHPISTPHR